MERSSRLAGFFFIVAAAVASYAVVTFIPRFAEEYEKAAAFHHIWGYIYLAVSSFMALAVITLLGWLASLLVGNTLRRRKKLRQQVRNPSAMSAAERAAEFGERLSEAKALAGDATLPVELRDPIRRELETLEDKAERQTLEIVAFGTVSSGKSSLLNALAGRDVFRTDPRGGTTLSRSEIPWPGTDRVVLVDTPGLAEIDGRTREDITKSAARDADLVLVVVDGALKSFEFALIENLAAMEKPLIVCLNKEDWYVADDRDVLLGQIAEQVRGLVSPRDILAVQASPIARTRTRVLADGNESEEQVELQADIAALADRMLAIVRRDGRDILLANLLMRSRGLVRDAKRRVQAALDERAQAVVERHMWQAGGAAALSPLPVLDVAASIAISTKMVIELARIYRQPIGFERASRLVSELGKNLLSILGTTAASPLVATAVASLLKTMPGVGTIAGGVLQGLVQALVTRWIGRVFIAYFKRDESQSTESLATLARAQWDEVTRPAELVNFVRTGLARLGGAR